MSVKLVCLVTPMLLVLTLMVVTFANAKSVTVAMVFPAKISTNALGIIAVTQMQIAPMQMEVTLVNAIVVLQVMVRSVQI